MKLTAEQQAVVDYRGPRLHVTAPAGSGKTTLLAAVVQAWVERDHVDPERIWAITFTRRAALHLQQTIESIGVPAIGFAGTVAALVHRLLWTYGYRYVPIDDQDLHDIIDVVGEKAAVADADKSKAERVLRNDPMRGGLSPDAQRLVKLVQAQMAAQRLIYQSQLLPNCLLHMTEDAKFLTWMRSQVDGVVWDEYQDVNPDEAMLLDLLAPARCVCVGDARQSLYQWRGASPMYLADETVPHMALSASWRCPEAVLDLANSLYPTMTQAYCASGRRGEVRYIDQAELVPVLLEDASRRAPVAVLTRTRLEAQIIAQATPFAIFVDRSRDAYATRDWRLLYSLARLACVNGEGFPYLERVVKWLCKRPIPVLNARIETMRQLAYLTDMGADWPDPVLDMPPLDFVAWYQSRDLQDVLDMLSGVSGIQFLCMTIHAAKGLEWPEVVVAGLGHSFPMGYGDMEGERSCLYVAATRASESLTIVGKLTSPAVKKLLTVPNA